MLTVVLGANNCEGFSLCFCYSKKKKKLFNGLIKVDPKLAENPCPNND
jgi:hypothetical protein